MLSGLSATDLRHWLKKALAGQAADLPQITPDEHPSSSILRLAKELDGFTLDKLRDACLILAAEFAADPQWQASGYEGELLFLLADLRLPVASISLQAMVPQMTDSWATPPGESHPADFETLPLKARQRILHAIHDIGHCDSTGFWTSLARENPSSYGGIAFSALLRHRKREEALALLPILPEEPDLVNGIVVLLELALNRLPGAWQDAFLQQVSLSLETCKPGLQEAIGKWLEANHYQMPMTAAPVLSTICPFTRERFRGEPASARLTLVEITEEPAA